MSSISLSLPRLSSITTGIPETLRSEPGRNCVNRKKTARVATEQLPLTIKTSSSAPNTTDKLKKLTVLGFTTKDSNTILSKQKYTQVAKAIENKYEEIIALGLNQAVVKIALSRGGTQSLPVALDKFQQLQKLGVDKSAIVKIASNSGGAQALQAVLDTFPQLQKLGLDKNAIVKIASNGGGAQALQAVLDSFPKLQKLGFDKDAQIKIASNNGGAQAIQAVLDSFPKLQKLGFDRDAIVKIASNNGGARAIQAVLDNFPKLQKLGFDKGALIKIASNNGGAQALQALLDKFQQLQKLGFDKDAQIKIASNASSAKNIIAISCFGDNLIEFGFTREQIQSIGERREGNLALCIIQACLRQLTTIEEKTNTKYSAKRFLEEATKYGGVKKYAQQLLNLPNLTDTEHDETQLLAVPASTIAHEVELHAFTTPTAEVPTEITESPDLDYLLDPEYVNNLKRFSIYEEQDSLSTYLAVIEDSVFLF